MNRLFLRVYLSIALLLLIAALAVFFILGRAFRVGGEQRLESRMSPMMAHARGRLFHAGDDHQKRQKILERLNRERPLPLQLKPIAELSISPEHRERLLAGDTLLVKKGRDHYLMAAYDEHEALVSEPFRPRTPRPIRARNTFLAILLAILLLIGPAIYLLLRPFERRILALADVAKRLGEGDLKSRVHLGGGDALDALGKSFNGMAGRIEQLVDSQKELLRAVSHELRTPLARLFFAVDDARLAETEAEKNRHLQRIEHSLVEMNELVEELLTLVREDREGPSREKQQFAVGAICEEAGELVRDLRKDLTLEIQGREASVYAAPRYFRRAVFNLVQNAVRHARSKVGLSFAWGETGVTVTVDDDGPGIPSRYRNRVFEPFFRMDASRGSDSGGSGLGLAIVRRIMTAHGGEARVEDSPHGGARLVLFFPAEQPTN